MENEQKPLYIVCKSGYSVLIPERMPHTFTDSQIEVLQQNWGKVEYKGTLSPQTTRRIAHILETWYRTLYIANSKLNLLNAQHQKRLVFITLTLSSEQTHTDNEIKRNMLNAFMVSMVRGWKMKNYLWKAEKQKNGNIHFHIITDVFVDKHALNHAWDSIQFRNGYLKKEPTMSKTYESPSTRIEVVNSNEGVSSYMSKYVGKFDENGKVQGRVWGCSNSVRELQDVYFEYDSETGKVLDAFAEKFPEKTKCGDFHVTFGKDLFFDFYLNCPAKRAMVNISYASNYHILYSTEQNIEQIINSFKY